MQENLSLAVIIPVFNRRDLIVRALDSVLAQTCQPGEIIVVDDGSTDDVADFLKQEYPMVRCLRQSRAGVSAARNRGIRASSSQWIALLDSDDSWFPEKLERQFEALFSRSKDMTGNETLSDVLPESRICHTDEIWIRDGQRVNQKSRHKKHDGWIYRYCLPLCAMSPSSIIIHRSVFDDVGFFDEELPACEDYDLWLRICARYSVTYVDQPLLRKYGGHQDQLSRQYWGMDRFRIIALEKMLNSGVLSEEDHHSTRQMMQYKLTILMQGARKRGKQDDIQHYSSLMNKYQLFKNRECQSNKSGVALQESGGV